MCEGLTLIIDNLNNYKYGFVTGELFGDSLISGNASVALQHFKKNQIIAFWYRKEDTEYYIVSDGKLLCDGKYYVKGDIIGFEPSEVRKILFVEDTDLMVVRTPGTQNDYYNYADASDEELIEMINSVYPAHEVPVKKIKNEDVSVIVQGPVSPLTIRTSRSIRQFLPGAEIILSTWEGTDVSGIDYDKIIFVNDPGGYTVDYKGNKYTDNTNRQLATTKEGLKCAERKYVLKLRSDSILIGDGITRFFDFYNKREEKYSFFSNRIVIGESFNVVSRTFDGNTIYLPFMVSDWFFFGLTEDLKKMFINTPFVERDEMVGYKYKNDITFHRYMRWNKIFHHKYCAEQYYLISALKRKFELKYDDLSDANDYNIKLSHDIIFNNFAVLNPRQHQIVNLKKIEDSIEGANCFMYENRYSNKDFLNDYGEI